MTLSHPTIPAVPAFSLHSLPGSAHGQQLERYGGFLDIKGERTGVVHIERMSHRWWQVTADGHGSLGIGVRHSITSMAEWRSGPPTSVSRSSDLPC